MRRPDESAESSAGARKVGEPIDISDGIPDRSAVRPRWRIVLIVVVFAAWVAFLIYCRFAGRVEL